MIQAENPDQIKNPYHPQVSSKVPGFSSLAPGSTPTIKKSDSTTPDQKTSKIADELESFKSKFYHWWHRIALGLLIFLGLKEFWEAIYFITVDYQELNTRLELHTVETNEVNQLISQAIVTAIIASVNILFAVRLANVKETTAHNIDLMVATFLIVTSWMIQRFLVQLDLLNLILNLLK
jgi:hypothetical protein